MAGEHPESHRFGGWAPVRAGPAYRGKGSLAHSGSNGSNTGSAAGSVVDLVTPVDANNRAGQPVAGISFGEVSRQGCDQFLEIAKLSVLKRYWIVLIIGCGR